MGFQNWLQDAKPVQIFGMLVVAVFVGWTVWSTFAGPLEQPEEGRGGVVPPPDETVAAEPSPEPAADPVTVEGSDGNTEPFVLPSGRMTVEITTEGDCHFGLHLRTEDGKTSGVRLPSVDGNSSVSSELYGVNGGEYFIEAFTGPPESCTWSATFTPR